MKIELNCDTINISCLPQLESFSAHPKPHYWRTPMAFYTDLHIHSHYTEHSNPSLTLEYLHLWAKLKGLSVVGTGDTTHPSWLKELHQKLDRQENGLYTLKPSLQFQDTLSNYPKLNNVVYFLPSVEVSTLFQKDGKSKKVHALCLLPTIENCRSLNQQLKPYANLYSNGRVNLGLSCKELLDMLLTISPKACLIPTHIWNPWYSILGSKSGFNTIEDCFEDLTPHIHTLESGPSISPLMCRMYSNLDPFTIISNSNAKSPEQLARECTIFDTELSYDGLLSSLKSGHGLLGTVEQFPVSTASSIDARERLTALSDRNKQDAKRLTKGIIQTQPLPETVSEIINRKSSASKKVQLLYGKLLEALGSELSILIDLDVNTIFNEGYPRLSEAIKRLRLGKVHFNSPQNKDNHSRPINIFSNKERLSFIPSSKQPQPISSKPAIAYKPLFLTNNALLTKIQEDCITNPSIKYLVTGGPGTGKSSLFAERLNYLLRSQLISPNELLVITFCESQKQFIKAKLPNAPITSLDEWCLDRLKHHYRCIKRRDNFFIISDQDKTYIINKLTNSHKEAELKSRQIKAYKQGVPKHLFPASFFSFFDYYQLECQRSNAIDCDDLCFLTKQLLQENPQLARLYQEKIKHVLIDDCQELTPSQIDLLKILVHKETLQSIFFSCDDNQRLFGYSGAHKHTSLILKEAFTLASVPLKKSYRCPTSVLNLSEQIINHSSQTEGSGLKAYIDISEQDTDQLEAEHLCKQLSLLIKDKDRAIIPKDIGIYYQNSEQLMIIEQHLNQVGIPFQYSALTLDREDHLTDLLNALKNIYFKTDASFPIRPEFNRDNLSIALQSGGSAWDIIEPLLKQEKIIEPYCQFLEALSENNVDLHSFLSTIAYRLKTLYQQTSKNAVSLVPIKACRSSTFKAIFIPGCDATLPTILGSLSTEELTRYIYTLITRSHQYLFISSAKKRLINGQYISQKKLNFLSLIKGFDIKQKKRHSKVIIPLSTI